MSLSVLLIIGQVSAFQPLDMGAPNAHSPSQIQCVGTSKSRTCIDHKSGNAFVVDRIGDQTTTHGYNPRTGPVFTHQNYLYGQPLQIDQSGTHWALHSQSIGSTEYVWGKSAGGKIVGYTVTR